MPMIDLTETAEYRMQMEEAIEANWDWFAGLGYADADFELKAWMLWHGVAKGKDGNAALPRPNSFNATI